MARELVKHLLIHARAGAAGGATASENAGGRSLRGDAYRFIDGQRAVISRVEYENLAAREGHCERAVQSTGEAAVQGLLSLPKPDTYVRMTCERMTSAPAFEVPLLDANDPTDKGGSIIIVRNRAIGVLIISPILFAI
jgi:hypothetical protein